MSVAIKVENLSKAYQIGQIGTGTISRDLERWWLTKVMRKEDPFLKLGETNDRSVKGKSDIVWSLKDIDFDIQQGDAVGIIGKNGAGKSTLLKLLSRVTAPTTGKIKLKGRVASLLEVGTGFHPELTGRENIYLNGSILGMRKKEIDQKLDEIIDFSGVERYIDTPVKRYSSGMYVRLAFAVAAHLESEILIVDEVLAVGDAEFQKKCLGKMSDISKGEGRTVLFVSHNMNAVKNLCNKGIVLKNGEIDLIESIDKCVERYSIGENLGENKLEFPIYPEKAAQFVFIQVKGAVGETNQIRQDENIKITGSILVNQVLHSCMVAVAIWSMEGFAVFTTTDWDSNPEKRLEKRKLGQELFNIEIPKNLLFPGRYFIRLGLGISGHYLYDQYPSTVEFEILPDGSIMSILGDARRGIITYELNWNW